MVKERNEVVFGRLQGLSLVRSRQLQGACIHTYIAPLSHLVAPRVLSASTTSSKLSCCRLSNRLRGREDFFWFQLVVRSRVSLLTCGPRAPLQDDGGGFRRRVPAVYARLVPPAPRERNPGAGDGSVCACAVLCCAVLICAAPLLCCHGSVFERSSPGSRGCWYEMVARMHVGGTSAARKTNSGPI